ncbi:MAG: outer membrane beta-barrel protein [Candidatus Latescibacteria bacterium]|nr:outer membrane beta-barrel protein [Candidatus Latescibacterota bacterium]NIM64789.1 outer membrane beta-barrel protein [Candidatus Latescibacterota bacterium]NIT38227.1 outer membrane beta-barrel protein [Candidatus Latescibacterota bacterium]
MIRRNRSSSHDNVSPIIVLCVLLLLFCPPISSAAQDETIRNKIEEARSLRAEGRYDQALDMIQALFEERIESAELQKQLHNEMIFTIFLKGDTNLCEEKAKEALLIFPELNADPTYFPPQLNDLYEKLRNDLFGSVILTTRPDSCNVLFGDGFHDYSPIHRKYVKSGEYEVTIQKKGYHKKKDLIQIEPGKSVNVEISLERVGSRQVRMLRPGVELGGSFTNFDYSIEAPSLGAGERRDGIFNFTAGGFVDIRILSRIILQPGIRWLRFGESARFSVDPATLSPAPPVSDPVQPQYIERAFTDFTRTLNYLAVPVKTKALLLNNPRLFLTIGSEFGYLISAKASGVTIVETVQLDTGEVINVAETEFDRDETSSMKSINYSIDGGLGVEFPMGNHAAFIYMRYSHGLRGLVKEGQPIPDRRTREILLSAGFIF